MGAESANRVRDRQSKEEMVTKGQIIFFFLIKNSFPSTFPVSLIFDSLELKVIENG